MQVVNSDQIEGSFDDPSIDTENESELKRVQYFEMLRQQYFDEQMRRQQQYDYRYSESNSRGQMIKTPNAIQFDPEDMYSYGTEQNTASANFRPRNSSTCLRRKNVQPREANSNSKG